MADGNAALADIARRYTLLAIRLADAYNQAQAGLKLDELLLPGTVSSEEGRARSLATLDRLRELTLTHREAYAKFRAAWGGEVAEALAHVTAPDRDAFRDGVQQRFEQHVGLQAEFYDVRLRWIDAAAGICRLLGQSRPSFGESGLTFANADDAAHFSELLGAAESAHQRETALFRERQARLKAAGPAPGETLH